MKLRSLVCTTLIIFLSGCTQQPTKPGNGYSGYLDSYYYARMTPVQMSSGQAVHRYISPQFKASNYHHAIVEKTSTYPKAHPSQHISARDLSILERQLTLVIKHSLGAVIPQANRPGRGVLKVESAITGIKVSDKELASYEYIPLAFLVASVSKQTGQRDQAVRLYLELKITDSYTNEVMAVSLREIPGEDLESVNARLQSASLNQGLINAASDMTNTVKEVFTR